MNAIEIADPSQAVAGNEAVTDGHFRGSGCKHDGGPLWISIPILDDPVVAKGSG